MRGSIIREESKNAQGISLTYTLIKGEGRYGKPFFSLFITESFLGEKECILLDDLTDDLEGALRIFSLFCDDTVTVCTASDVLEELIYS